MKTYHSEIATGATSGSCICRHQGPTDSVQANEARPCSCRKTLQTERCIYSPFTDCLTENNNKIPSLTSSSKPCRTHRNLYTRHHDLHAHRSLQLVHPTVNTSNWRPCYRAYPNHEHHPNTQIYQRDPNMPPYHEQVFNMGSREQETTIMFLAPQIGDPLMAQI